MGARGNAAAGPVPRAGRSAGSGQASHTRTAGSVSRPRSLKALRHLRSWPAIFALIAAGYVALRLSAFLQSPTLRYPDTGTYLRSSGFPLFSEQFLAGQRAWALPLLYRALPDSDTARAVGQLVVSIGCWLALAAAVAWNVRHTVLRAVAFGSVLVFSLSVWVTQWDRLLLSESLAVSLTAAVLAAWLALVRAPNRWTVAALLGTTLLWAAVRDSNAYVVGLVLLPAALWAVVARPRRLPLVVVGGARRRCWACPRSPSRGPRPTCAGSCRSRTSWACGC